MRRWLTLLFFALVFGGWLLGWSPYFRVTSITVVGAQHITDARIISASGIEIGQPMARVSTARVERALSSIPRIDSFEIRRRWPHQLILAVTERLPLAMCGDLAVDRDGTRFALKPDEPLPRVKIIINSYSRQRARQWFDIFFQLPGDVRESISSVTLRSDDDISFRAGTVEFVWGSGEQTPLKVDVLSRLLAQPDAPTWKRVDLSAPLAPTTTKR